MAKLSSPCFNCPDRKLACHSKCNRYIGFRNSVDTVNHAREQYKSRVYEYTYSQNKSNKNKVDKSLVYGM